MSAWIELHLSGGRLDYVRSDTVVEVVERRAYGQTDKTIGSFVHVQSGRELEVVEMARDVLELLRKAGLYDGAAFSSDKDGSE